MVRFSRNRRWTFILALGVALLFSAASYHGVAADPYEGDDGSEHIGPGTIPADPSDPGPPGLGDPDVPTGAGKMVRPGSHVQYQPIELVAGDGKSSRMVLIWRLRVVLLGLRHLYLGY